MQSILYTAQRTKLTKQNEINKPNKLNKLEQNKQKYFLHYDYFHINKAYDR